MTHPEEHVLQWFVFSSLLLYDLFIYESLLAYSLKGPTGGTARYGVFFSEEHGSPFSRYGLTIQMFE